MRPLKSINVLLDQAFFIFAGLASLWLAWLVFRESWFTGGWWMIGLFFVVWIIVAYLALPRLHRILSSIYVPNYFIGRTRTADGILSDPVNLAARGSEEQLHKVMDAAGWSLADDITPRSAWKMVTTVLRRKSYPNAPVSPAFLFGRKQDFAYQQEVTIILISATMCVFGAVRRAGCCRADIGWIGWPRERMTEASVCRCLRFN